jgi:hypothetical protein
MVMSDFHFRAPGQLFQYRKAKLKARASPDISRETRQRSRMIYCCHPDISCGLEILMPRGTLQLTVLLRGISSGILTVLKDGSSPSFIYCIPFCTFLLFRQLLILFCNCCTPKPI